MDLARKGRFNRLKFVNKAKFCELAQRLVSMRLCTIETFLAFMDFVFSSSVFLPSLPCI